MKKQIPLFISLVFLLFQACQKDWHDCDEPFGPDRLYVFDVPVVEELILESNLDLHVYFSRNARVEIEAAENIAAHIDVIIRGGTVIIDNFDCVRNRHARVNVYTPNLFYINNDGSGDIIFHDYNDVHQVTLEINGSGDIEYMGESRELECVIDGSGDIFLTGETSELEIYIHGSGDIHAFDLYSDYCYIEVDGSGDSEVWVERQLEVEVNGSGDVYFIGFPNVAVRGRGSGRVIDAN